ncbi:MAG: hypothetical protein LBK83_04840 [Treponema sp.]|jgi:hypothetical protein|nr:hypothetical protein [Treponema sp.]
MTTELVTVSDARKNGALVYINEGYLNPSTPLYRTEVTAIILDVKNDCHKISGKLMLKREVVDRVGEACAISYVPSGCRTWTETRDDSAGKRTVFISEQQGKMRLPDGSYRTGSVQAYEFDPNLRAMLDFGITEWNEQTKQQQKEGKPLAKMAMEYSKFGRQRAETGARLRVVKELTGMPTAFELAEAGKPLVFSRVVQNTDYLLKTPEGRLLAAAQATGTQDVIKDLYGRQALPGQGGEAEGEPRNVTEKNPGGDQNPAGADLAKEAAGEDWGDLEREGAGDEFQELTISLEQYLSTYRERLDVDYRGKNGTVNPYRLARAEFENPEATAETRRLMIGRINNLLKSTEAS